MLPRYASFHRAQAQAGQGQAHRQVRLRPMPLLHRVLPAVSAGLRSRAASGDAHAGLHLHRRRNIGTNGPPCAARAACARSMPARRNFIPRKPATIPRPRCAPGNIKWTGPMNPKVARHADGRRVPIKTLMRKLHMLDYDHAGAAATGHFHPSRVACRSSKAPARPPAMVAGRPRHRRASSSASLPPNALGRRVARAVCRRRAK